MKVIKLTRGKIAIVNNRDFARLNKFKWHASFNGWTWYAQRSIGPRNDRKKIHMHREILGCKNGQEADHKNGNGLDNRRSNLRKATSVQNNRNHTITPQTGVSKVRNKFQARIYANGDALYLGSFSTPKQAHDAYLTAAKKYFGKFTRATQHGKRTSSKI